MSKRQAPAILLVALGLLGACSTEGSDTRIVAAVWSDLAVPGDIDNIRIDVFGSSDASRSASFPLHTGGTSGTASPLAILEILSPNPLGSSFTVTATGLSGSAPVVSRTLTVTFDPGHSRLLTIFLARICKGSQSECCSKSEKVDGASLLLANTPFLAPDWNMCVGNDGGISDGAGRDGAGSGGADQAGSNDGTDSKGAGPGAEVGGDVTADGGPAKDGAVDLPEPGPEASPVVDAAAEAPADLSGPADAARDLPLPEASASGDAGQDSPDAALDAAIEARAEAPKLLDVPADSPPDVATAPESGPDLPALDDTPVCTLPMTSCSGVCIDPRTDSENCGHCSNACSSKVCRSATCLATATYGNYSSGVTSSAFGANLLAGIQVFIPDPSVVTALGAVLFNASVSVDMYLGLYQDVAGNPGALVATVKEPAFASSGGNNLSVDPPVDVLAGTYWILGVWKGAATFASNSTTAVTWRWISYPYAALPSTAPTGMSAINLPPPNLYVIVAQ